MITPQDLRSISERPSLRRYRIGLFGLGVVGSGLCRMLEGKSEEIVRRFGVSFEIAAVCVKDKTKRRAEDLAHYVVTDDAEALLTDDSIDIVIELIGGHYEALQLIESALDRRKHVITANKLLLSRELPRLRKRAERQGVHLEYSASVCGSVPVLKAIDEFRCNDEILSIRGIVNGSTNYILTAMSESGCTFEDACKLARTNGFLEADPTLDLSGQDAAQKLSVLMYHAFDTHIHPNEISRSGIYTIDADSITRAQVNGKSIKLIAQAERTPEGRITCFVGPQEIDAGSLFAATRDEFNVLEVTTRYAGQQILYGKGAGSFPTASAVMSDLLTMVRG